MAIVNDLVEDWIEIRSKLQRQLKMLESGEMNSGTAISEATTQATIARIKSWVGDLNALLKEYARADRS